MSIYLGLCIVDSAVINVKAAINETQIGTSQILVFMVGKLKENVNQWFLNILGITDPLRVC